MANHVQLASYKSMDVDSSTVSDDIQARLLYILRRYAGNEMDMSLELLFGSILSSKMESDLVTLNPYLTVRLGPPPLVLCSTWIWLCVEKEPEDAERDGCCHATARQSDRPGQQRLD